MQSICHVALIASLLAIAGCGKPVSPAAQPISTETTEAIAPTDPDESSARIVSVETTGDSGRYTFSVTLQSPDTGCDRYANWWEVITPEGELLYRRILAHSHVDEQPFTRAGGPVDMGEGDEVIVRSHMYPDGYSEQAMQGNIQQGFTPTVLSPDFAQALVRAEPQPSSCTF